MKQENLSEANKILHNLYNIEQILVKQGLKPFFYYGKRKLRVKKFAIVKALMWAYKTRKPITIMNKKNMPSILQRKPEDYRQKVMTSLQEYREFEKKLS